MVCFIQGTESQLCLVKNPTSGALESIGVQTFPRLRARLAFEIVNRLWVVAGVDDALNDSADFFMGLQIRFNDQDLRSLLPFLGGALSGG